MIYLDNNATTQLDPLVAGEFLRLLEQRHVNPSSQHGLGRLAKRLLETSREALLTLCGANTHGMSSDQLVFTSGGTESNNLALFGLAATRPGTIYASSIEHPSVLGPIQQLQSQGRDVVYLPCKTSGLIDLNPLFDAITQRPNEIAFVALMLANNETGAIQPVREAAIRCREHMIPIHCDAVQAFGKMPLSFRDLQVDTMTITAHKCHGPLGIGALILRDRVTVSPQLFGGFQQLGIRPGTEMPAMAGAFAFAVDRVVRGLETRVHHMRSLRDAFETSLREKLAGIEIIGGDAPRLPNTSCIAFPGIDRQVLHVALDQLQIACSTGSACASGSSQPSHVLQAMGLPQEWVKGALRFSLSFETTREDIEQAAERIAATVTRLVKKV